MAGSSPPMSACSAARTCGSTTTRVPRRCSTSRRTERAQTGKSSCAAASASSRPPAIERDAAPVVAPWRALLALHPQPDLPGPRVYHRRVRARVLRVSRLGGGPLPRQGDHAQLLALLGLLLALLRHPRELPDRQGPLVRVPPAPARDPGFARGGPRHAVRGGADARRRSGLPAPARARRT